MKRKKKNIKTFREKERQGVRKSQIRKEKVTFLKKKNAFMSCIKKLEKKETNIDHQCGKASKLQIFF